MLSLFILAVVVGFSWIALAEHVLTITHLPHVQRARNSRAFMVFFYAIIPFVTIVSLIEAATRGKFLATVRAIGNRTINLR